LLEWVLVLRVRPRFNPATQRAGTAYLHHTQGLVNALTITCSTLCRSRLFFPTGPSRRPGEAMRRPRAAAVRAPVDADTRGDIGRGGLDHARNRAKVARWLVLAAFSLWQAQLWRLAKVRGPGVSCIAYVCTTPPSRYLASPRPMHSFSYFLTSPMATLNSLTVWHPLHPLTSQHRP
jgi:hypothetical protein